MTYQWLDGATVLDLLHDLRRAASGDVEGLQIDRAPSLFDHRPVIGQAFALKGIVTGHPHLSDGREIVTSQLFYLNSEIGIARTMNRWYRLRGPGRGH
ncbi:DUF6634 family protein [Rhizobium sp. R693]|uniref:DUF6634 family protein n=1 Tax=Rhizobium sp. R693 TaxID=1764276 RepID=UPI0011313FAA|nr:DUF6634 family protein [Rhizobium sp. R693]